MFGVTVVRLGEGLEIEEAGGGGERSAVGEAVAVHKGGVGDHAGIVGGD